MTEICASTEREDDSLFFVLFGIERRRRLHITKYTFRSIASIRSDLDHREFRW